MSRASRRLRIAQACLAGIALGSLLGGSLPPLSYSKDIQQEYLIARALRDGIDLFTPVSDLATHYFPPGIGHGYFPHPCMHPPVLALISLPLTLMPFPVVVLLWLGLNVALLIAVGRWLGLSLRWSLALAAWPPLWCLLYVGQFELVILVLAMLGWRAAAAGRDGPAGVWLGLAAAIKLYPALLLVPFLLRRRLRILVAAGAVVGLSQVGNLVAVGPSGVIRYYTEIVPGVSRQYMDTALNSSPYGAFVRLFRGTADVPPVTTATGVVLPLTIAFSLLALVGLVKLEPQAAPVALLVGLPAVWYSYVVLALPQIVTLLRSRQFWRATLLAVVAASFVLPLLSWLVLEYVRWGGTHVPPVALLLAIQPAGCIGLLVLSLIKTGSQHTEPVNLLVDGERTAQPRASLITCHERQAI